jgi:hypothetical protein
MDQHSLASDHVELLERRGAALACFLYPAAAGFAFATHPNLLTLSLEKTTAARVAAFHGNGLMHFGHLMMGIGSMLLVFIALEYMRMLRPSSPWTSLIGGVTAIVGAMILAMDKAALCFVPSAFDTLPEAQFQALMPGIEAMFGFQGWLGILRLLPLLPLGFVILGVGLVKSRAIPRREAIPLLLGALLMCNPDIDLIGLVATVVLAVGMWNSGLRLWTRRT